MISLEILKAPNEDYLGQYNLFFNEMQIGRKYGEIFFPSLQIPDILFTLEIANTHLKITTNKLISSYLVNGKRTVRPSLLKANDSFSFQNIEFKVINFLYEEPYDKKTDLNNCLDYFIESSHPLLNIIKDFRKG